MKIQLKQGKKNKNPGRASAHLRESASVHSCWAHQAFSSSKQFAASVTHLCFFFFMWKKGILAPVFFSFVTIISELFSSKSLCTKTEETESTAIYAKRLWAHFLPIKHIHLSLSLVLINNLLLFADAILHFFVFIFVFSLRFHLFCPIVH